MIPEIEELIKFRDEHAIVARIASYKIGITERSLIRLEQNHNQPKPETLKKIRNYLKREKAKIRREEERQVESIKIPLLELINSEGSEFIPKPLKSGRYQPSVEKNGILLHSVFLKNLVETLKTDESIIIKTLEILASEGRIKIFKLTISNKGPADNNFRIRCELGIGERDIHTSKITVLRLFKDDPLIEEELKEVILNLGERISYERKRKHDFFQKKYGGVGDGSAVEKMLRKEDEKDARIIRDALLEKAKK